MDVDILTIVAALLAASIGQVFDCALLIVIFATSGALEAIVTRRTADSVRALLVLAPEQATRLGRRGIRPHLGARVGDVVLVRPGERVGGDGEVVDGLSEVDQASITGEPLPVTKTVGDEVFAGTLNGTGALRVTMVDGLDGLGLQWRAAWRKAGQPAARHHDRPKGPQRIGEMRGGPLG